MKTRGTNILIISLLSALLFVGCAEETSTSAPGYAGDQTNNPVNNPTDTGSSSSIEGSNVVTLNIVGSTTTQKITNFAEYTGRSMYNPQNIQLHVNLVDRGGANYGGTIKVTYVDNGVQRTGVFVNGDNSYYLKYMDKKEAAKYNKWFKVNGKWVFHGFFQDDSGAVILVLDGSSDILLGDGQVPKNYKGSLYYKNFGDTVVYQQGGPHPNKHCWFLYEYDGVNSPYECRAWESGDGVNTYKSLYPGSGYKKLGTFQGLSVEKSFN